MATIKQIVLKAVEVKAAAEVLEGLLQDRNKAVARVDDVNGQIAPQQVEVNRLVAELKALLNE